MRYNLVGGGGTFDHFHVGHEAFLRAMLSTGNAVLLGITSDEYAKNHKKWPESVQPYRERKQAVLGFLQKESAVDRVKIAKINSLYIPKKWNSMPIQALVVTSDTKAGAEELKRRQTTSQPFDIIVVDFLTDTSGSKISSSDIRGGIIQVNGKPYVPSNFGKKDLFLPENDRAVFSRPFGKLYKTVSEISLLTPDCLISVGDIVTETCLKSGIRPKVSVIDLRSERKRRNVSLGEMGFSGIETLLHTINPASHISSLLVKQIRIVRERLSKNKQCIIQVEGEEDLSVIPLILLMPLSWQILYGQPHEGVVLLTITPEVKLSTVQLLKKFIAV